MQALRRSALCFGEAAREKPVRYPHTKCTPKSRETAPPHGDEEIVIQSPSPLGSKPNNERQLIKLVSAAPGAMRRALNNYFIRSYSQVIKLNVMCFYPVLLRRCCHVKAFWAPSSCVKQLLA